jgi:hypothetical protein
MNYITFNFSSSNNRLDVSKLKLIYQKTNLTGK